MQYSIRGFAGNTMGEVRFRREVMDITVYFLYALFPLSRDGIPDIETLKRREAGVELWVKECLYGR